MQMRSLLHDYLATDGNQAYRLGRQPTADGNMFQRNNRERNKVSNINIDSALLEYL